MKAYVNSVIDLFKTKWKELISIVVIVAALCVGICALTMIRPPETIRTVVTVSGTDGLKIEEVRELTAEEVVIKLKELGMPIGYYIVYDEVTDENGLLGRPNQYTSKVNFEDTNCEQFDLEYSPVGGSIEVFTTPEDAKTRYDYIKGVTEGNSSLSQYMYLDGIYLLRVDYDVVPISAQAYEEAFLKIINESSVSQTDIVSDSNI